MAVEGLDSINFNHVLNSIEFSSDPPSRAEIAKQVGLSRTALSYIVQKLIAMELVMEQEKENDGKPGRPGTPLVLNPNVWHSIGASFYSHEWCFVSVNLLGAIQSTYCLQVKDNSQQEILGALLEGLKYMKANSQPKLLPAFGVGAPGLVDARKGTIERADDLGWNNTILLGDLIRKSTGLDSFILNRYCANGIEEIEKKQYTKRFENIVYLGMGTAMAGTVFLGGKFVENTKYRLGHIVINPNGERCHCGQEGCLQTMVCEQAWIRKAEALGLQGIRSGQDISQLAENGNELARRCILEIAKPLSMGLAIIVNVLNPDLIILGGPLGSSSQYLLDTVRELMKSRILDYQYEHITMVKGDAGKYSSAVGAALLPLKQKYELLNKAQ